MYSNRSYWPGDSVLSSAIFLQVSGGKKAGKDTDGVLILKYPVFIAVVGYFSILVGLIFGFITVTQIVPTSGDELVPFLVIAFVTAGLPFVIMQKNVRVVAGKDKAVFVGMIKRKREIRWSDIQKVLFIGWTSKLSLQSETEKIKISTMMKGYIDLKDLVQKKPGEDCIKYV